MSSLFAQAKKLESPKTAKVKSSDKLEVQIPQLQQFAEIKALIQSLTATAETLEGEIKLAGFEKFLELAGSKRPESFRGVDGMASASVELRKRGTNSALNEEEVKVLEAQGITPFKHVVTPELFGINPVYATNSALLGKVEKALAKIVPPDFLVLQAEVSKNVVSEEMLDKAFQSKDRACISITTTMALKPKLNDGYPMESLFDNVKEIVQPTPAATKVASKKAA